MKLRKVDGYWNYDKSEFSEPSALLDDDDELERIYNKLYSLEEFTAPSNFKSYEELKTRFELVLSGVTPARTVETLMEDEPVATPKVETKPEAPPRVSQVAKSDESESEDVMSYFEKLAEEA